MTLVSITLAIVLFTIAAMIGIVSGGRGGNKGQDK